MIYRNMEPKTTPSLISKVVSNTPHWRGTKSTTLGGRVNNFSSVFHVKIFTGDFFDTCPLVHANDMHKLALVF